MKINELLKLTNKQFSIQVKSFNLCCAKAGIKPTKRQAAKWRRKEGLAYFNH